MEPKEQGELSQERKKDIYKLLKRIGVSQNNMDFINHNESHCLSILNEALTHTSANSKNNHERLEFLGDAVLRLAASEYIQAKFPFLKVGDRSALRAQIVSDEWLANVGCKVSIKETMLIGLKAHKDDAASATLQAEAIEALIGGIYECLKDITAITDWLSPHWDESSKRVLADPYRLNAKSALQEWSQGKSFDKPDYQIKELSKKHGDQNRFFCKVIINQMVLGEGYGSSRKQAEKEAAKVALEKLETS